MCGESLSLFCLGLPLGEAEMPVALGRGMGWVLGEVRAGGPPSQPHFHVPSLLGSFSD